jgi:hypothetical protein
MKAYWGAGVDPYFLDLDPRGNNPRPYRIGAVFKHSLDEYRVSKRKINF